MIPNAEIWGTSDTWRSPNYLDTGGEVCERIDGKLPVFDSSLDGEAKFFLRTGVYNNKLVYGQPLDSSCCPWRIKGDSHWINGLKLLSFEQVDNTRRSKLDYVYNDETRGNGCPIMLSVLTSLDGELYNNDYMWSPDYTQPGFTPVTYQQTSPLLKFDYSKIVIVPSIRASATPGGTTSRYGLDEYINGTGITDKPYIQALNFRFWTRDSNNVLRDSDGMISIHPFNAVCNGADVSVPSLAEEFTSYEGFFDGDSYNSSGHGDSYVDFNPNDIGNTVKETNDNYYASNHGLPYIACPENAVITLDTGEYEVRASWTMTAEEIVTEYAKLGFWIWAGGDGTGNVTPTWDPETPDEHTIIPLFDSYGTTTGEYIRGADAIYAPAASWRDDIFERDVYHGEPPYDPSDYNDNTTVLPDLSTSYIPTTAKLYPMQAGTVISLIAYLNNVSANLNSDYDSTTKFLTNNPIDVICALMYYPFDITNIYSGELPAVDDIVLGNVQTDIQATHLNKALVEYNAGSCVYYPPNGINDFRSYKPYSSAELYVPYCGSVSIDPTDFIGHTIKVKYLIDLQTGSCIALIYRDNMVLTTINGQIGVSVPLTGVQTATLQAAQQRADSAQKSAQIQAASAAVSAVAAAGAVIAAAPTGGASVAAFALLGTANTLAMSEIGNYDRYNDMQYQLDHQQTPYKTVGAASAVTSMGNEQACRLIIKRPIMLDSFEPAVYAHNTGYACCITAPLSTFSGYVKVSNADVDNIPCTAAERSALLQALQAGVYL